MDIAKIIGDGLAAYFTPENVPSMIGTVITFGFAVWSWFNNRSTKKRAERMQTESLRLQLDNQRIAWSGLVIDAMAKAETLVRMRGDPGGQTEVKRGELLATLSAQVDRGRLYFANVTAAELGVPPGKEKIGADRPGAFQGYRRSVLDCVVLVHNHLRGLQIGVDGMFLGDLGKDGSLTRSANMMLACRRRFVSELQELIGRERLAIDDKKLTVKDLGDGIPSWDNVTDLVADFETLYGEKSFWDERPPVKGEGHRFQQYIEALSRKRMNKKSIAERLQARGVDAKKIKKDEPV